MKFPFRISLNNYVHFTEPTRSRRTPTSVAINMFVVTTIVCYIIIIIIIGEIDYRKNYPRKYVNNIVT